MRVFKNTFLKGLNGDLDYAITPEEGYVSAHNLTLSAENKFYALSNIQGTQELETLISSFSGRVLGVYAVKFKIESLENVESLLIFTSDSNTLKIWAYAFDTDTKYELFEESYTGYDAAIPEIDAIDYSESGLSIVYFTDNFNEIRKLRCEIPVGYTPNFITPEKLSLQRRGTIASVNLDSIQTTGGSLLCGSYQFSLRFYNSATKTYTKWTIPSSPINISQVTSNVGLGSYNAVSSKFIRMQIKTPDNEFALYTHFQFSVIENTQSVNGTNASLLKLEDLTVDSTSGGFTITNFDYKSNSRIDFVPITDIVVDLAAIDHVKTLQVKNNKLFAGNIVYTTLDYDNEPTVTGSISRVTVNNTDDFQTSTRRGMWRDEVYRYYISYYDSKYNFSRPKTLDMSAVVDNQISNGDLKTPSKKKSGFTLLAGSTNKTNLNLSLTIDSHPTWARGFIILRAKRKARIKFQTPFVPSCLIQGIDVIGNYPNRYTVQVGTDSRQTVDSPNASPMNPVGTHVLKNYMFPVRRDYVKVVNDNPSIKLEAGELKVAVPTTTTSSNRVYFSFTPDTYITGESAKRYTYTDGDKYEIVDYAFLKLSHTSYTTNTVAPESNIGNFVDTSVHGTFYATAKNDYYYSDSVNRSDPSSPVKSGKVVAFKELDNLGQGTQIGGNSVGEFGNLVTNGIIFNPSANNQKTAAMLLDADKLDSTWYAQSGAIVSAGGGSISDTFFETTEATQSNTFVFVKSGFVDDSSYVSLVDIANITTEQSDDRYGEPGDLHDMVFTGANYAFSASEVSTVESSGSLPISLSVAGGDCYTSLHQFKLTDSHYGMLNVEKSGAGSQLSERNLLKRWGKIWGNRFQVAAESPTDGDECICLPVQYRNLSQVLSVVIESEINGEVLAPRAYPIVNNLQNENGNEYNLRTPFTYIYNANYSKTSDQKAFVPFDPNENLTTKFKARGVFSDQKIYNSLIEGFDVFRADSNFDLEETYGGITKLVLSGNELIALQEKAVVYLPVDAQMTEAADGTVLSLRSSATIDIPRYISRQYGCQHIKGVCQIDSSVFFPDAFNKAVLKFGDGQLELISENGMIKNIHTLFTDSVSPQYITSLFDNKRRQYWLISNEPGNTNCWVWDDRLKVWVGNYEFQNLYGGVYTHDEVQLVGKDTDLKIYRMYSGNYSSLMGVSVTPRVQLSINPEFEIAKTFDDLVVYSSAAMATADMITESDSGENQTVNGMILAVNPREGNYRIPTLRDSNSARLRGLRSLLTLKWGNDNSKISLNSVVTKYRESQRKI